MKLSAADVIGLARQARFNLSADEVERFRAQLNSILEQMDVLDELGRVDPAVVLHDGNAAVRLRADENVRDASGQSQDALSGDVVAGFFTVPRLLPSAGQPE